MREACNGRLYVLGGTEASQTLDSVEVFDPLTDSWTAGKPMGSRRHGAAALSMGGRVYVMGGWDGRAAGGDADGARGVVEAVQLRRDLRPRRGQVGDGPPHDAAPLRPLRNCNLAAPKHQLFKQLTFHFFSL
jgi:hypothetical protein